MTDATANAIEIRNFHKRYGDVYAVQGLTLSVKRGVFFAFVGPNGAGKSTTINAMVGLLRPSQGSIGILGHDVEKEPLQAKALTGFMPEEVVLYERMTAREYLSFVGRMYLLPGEVIEERTRDLLGMLDLDGSKLMGAFSLGMKKKAALAAALIHRPPVVILDEPFSGIDATTASRVRTALGKMVADGHTVFFSSHVLETVERISSEVGIIDKGRLLAVGTLPQIKTAAGCDSSATLEDAFLRLVGAAGPEGASS